MAADAAPSASGTPAEPAAPPQAGTPSAPISTGGGESAPQAGADAESFSLDDARKLRSEAQSLRRRLKEFEDAKRAEDDAKLSEHERLQRRVAEYEQQVAAAQAAARTLRTRLAVEREARALRLVDEDAAYRLLDADRIEYDPDSGEPKNVRALLKKLAEDKPYLVAPDPAAAPPAASAPPAFGIGTPLAGTPRPDNAQALAAQEQQRLRAEVQQRARALL